MRSAVTGALDRSQRNRRPRHSEIDWNRTIRANLRHWQPDYRTIVPEECVADKHEGPHFANLYDMVVKYADVLSIDDTLAQLRQVAPAVGAGR